MEVHFLLILLLRALLLVERLGRTLEEPGPGLEQLRVVHFGNRPIPIMILMLEVRVMEREESLQLFCLPTEKARSQLPALNLLLPLLLLQRRLLRRQPPQRCLPLSRLWSLPTSPLLSLLPQ